MGTKPLFIASDHGGFHRKQALVAWLRSHGHPVTDLGPTRLEPDDDYPLFAAKVAQAVQLEPGSLGILLCRSGQGVALVANKFAGIRAATAWNEDVARAAAEDDEVNVLCLPSDYVTDAAVNHIVTAWFASGLKTDERYHRRLQEIATIEQRNGLQHPREGNR